MDIIERIFALVYTPSKPAHYLCRVSRHTLRFVRQLMYRSIVVDSGTHRLYGIFDNDWRCRAFLTTLHNLNLQHYDYSKPSTIRPLQRVTYTGPSSAKWSRMALAICKALLQFTCVALRVVTLTDIPIGLLPGRRFFVNLQQLEITWRQPWSRPELLIYWLQDYKPSRHLMRLDLTVYGGIIPGVAFSQRNIITRYSANVDLVFIKWRKRLLPHECRVFFSLLASTNPTTLMLNVSDFAVGLPECL